MQWSNLNEQMIEQFFQNSNSPSNASVSLNFTRTSRQNYSNQKEVSSNQKQSRETSPRISQHQVIQKLVNPETDLLSFSERQIQTFDFWMRSLNTKKQKSFDQINNQITNLNEFHMKKNTSNKHSENQSVKFQEIKQNILTKLSDIEVNCYKNGQSQCQNCLILNHKISTLQTHIKEVQNTLKIRQFEIKMTNQTKINQLGQQLQFKVQNRLLNDQLKKLMQKYSDLNELVKDKNRDILRLNQQVEKYSLQKSTFHFKNKTLQNRLHQMEKSKSLLLSAAKNSTTHSEFNITTHNNNVSNLRSSQNGQQQNDTFIQTNQFNCDKNACQADDCIAWFQKIKIIFMQKYKKQQKQHLLQEQHKNQMQIGQAQSKQIITQFRKKHAKYEIARSCKNIADYIKKNKQNFFQLLGQELSSNFRNIIKQKSIFMVQKQGQRCSTFTIQEYQQELKKAQKISAGFQSEMKNLGSQLKTLRHQLKKQKQEKFHLNQQLNILRQSLENQSYKDHSFDQNQQKMIEYINEIQNKNQQIKKLVIKCKKIEDQKQQAQAHLKQQLQNLMIQQRKQKIKWFNESFINCKIITACKIRNKNISQKHLPSTIHQFQGRVFVQRQNEKNSFKYDIIEHSNKKITNDIQSSARKLIKNCFYGSNQSALISIGYPDSEFRELMRNQNGLLISSMSQIFRMKQSQKRYLQTNISLQIIEVTNNQIIDLLDFNRSNLKISIKKNTQKIYLPNCEQINLYKEEQARQLYIQSLINRREQASHIIVIFKLALMDKKTKDQFQSKLIFAEVGLDQKQQSNLNLIKDTEALWRTLNSIYFKQISPSQNNRLTYLFSDTLNQKNKNMLIVNVSPVQRLKQHSLKALSYGSSLKSVVEKKNLGGNISRTPQPSFDKNIKRPFDQEVNKLRHNFSQHQIPQSTNQDISQEKSRLIKHRNSSSQLPTENIQKKKRTISRLSIC